MMVLGNTSVPDPLQRLPSTLSYMALFNTHFVVYNQADVVVDGQHVYDLPWGPFVYRFTELTSFVCAHCGITALPSFLPPKVTNMLLNNNLMTGPLPSNMLSLLNTADVTSLKLDFSNNLINGAIPSDFFSNFPGVTISLGTFYIDFSNNKLQGPLPANLLAKFSFTAQFTILLDNAGLSGAIPNSFLKLSNLNPGAAVIISMQHNDLSGTIPSDFITSMGKSSPERLTIRLSDNILTGGLPKTLLNFTDDCNLKMLSIDVQSNHLNGIIEDFGELAECTALTNFSLYAAHNTLTGGLPRLRLGSNDPNVQYVVSVSNNKLNGSIPWDLLLGQSFTQTNIDVSSNFMVDSPFDFIASLPSLSNITVLQFHAADNNFTGSVPERLFANWTSGTSSVPGSILIDLSYNQIQGSIPDYLLAGVQGDSLSIRLYLAHNQIDGFFPENLYDLNDPSPGITLLDLDLSWNSIQSLPPYLFPTGTPTMLETFQLSLDSNRIEGPLGASFFSALVFSLKTITLNLNNNRIGSTIPTTFFQFSNSARPTLTLSMSNCSLIGTLPKLFNDHLAGMTLSLANNKLHGDFKISQLIENPATAASTSFVLDLSANQLNGTFAFDWAGSTSASFGIRASSNNLTSLVIRDNPYTMKRLDISDNPHLTGELPSTLFKTAVVAFQASNTALSGFMPQPSSAGTGSLLKLLVANTAIDFCNPADLPFFNATNLETCNLYGSNVANCSSKYPAICFATPAPSYCNPATQPSALFNCIGGVWTLNTTFTSPTFVIPSGATQTVVQGDVTSSTIVFGSIGSTLNVTGCLNNLTLVTLELTPSEIKALTSGSTILLISYNGNDPSCKDLSSVQVDLRARGSTCRRVTAATTPSTAGTLSAILSINTSRCNTWWIILVSVICGVIVVAVIIFVLLVIFVPAVRTSVRPYSKKRPSQALAR